MNTVEQKTAEGVMSLELFSQNLNLERMVERKTERLRKQGEELQNTLRTLQHTQTQLLQANKLEAVGQLAAGVAHEINTPAQFVGTNIDFLNESFNEVSRLVHCIIAQLPTLSSNPSGEQANAAITAMLAEIDWEYLNEEIPAAIRQSRDGIQRISAIVQAMKEFSHPSSKEKVLNDVNKLLETTIVVATNEWKYVAEVHTDLDPNLPQIPCLADELNQAFLNILVNAAHAIESKLSGQAQAAKGKITISTRHDEQYVEVRVSDTGTGIAKEAQNRVFDPFFTTKCVGKGTGQGLAIAHDVITRKHGGTITFTTEPGRGTEFVLRLPLGE